MSSSLSGLSPITAYLSIVKNEQTQVAQMVKSDSTVQRTVKAFQSDIVDINSPTDLLNPKNQAALQVVLGAYNMSGESSSTGLIKQLLTQDPSASGSLVRSLNDTDDLHFVKAMTDRATVTLDFGDPTASSFTSGGSTASSISFNNLAGGMANSSLTAASPAETFSYVLDDGSAAQSVAKALTTALQSTGTGADPVAASYSVDAGGAIIGSSGAPAVATSTDSAGNTVYSLTLATSSTGAAIRLASVVAVKAPQAAASAVPSGTISAATAVPLLSKALAAKGFNVSSSSTGSLSIINPIDNGALSLSPQSYTSFAAITPQAVSTFQNVLPLGSAGQALKAGQVLTSGGAAIGTIKSVDAAGDVTLTAPSALALAAGARIDVAIGAGIANIGTKITASTATATNTSTLALGQAGVGLKPGQVITDGSNVVGIVKSVDGAGNVTLQGNLAVPVAAGDTLGTLPHVSDTQTPALDDAGNVATILSQYETSQYETQEGQQIPGMDDALYFTRTMPTITSITQLMSDTRLLNVVTTNLGLSDTYDQLPYDQQVSLLTSKVKLSDYANPTKLHQAAEQFLALTGEQAASGGNDTDPASVLLSGGSDSSDGDVGSSLMSALYPGSDSSSSSGLDPILSALYA